MLSSKSKAEIEHVYRLGLSIVKAVKLVGVSKQTIAKYYAMFRASKVQKYTKQDIMGFMECSGVPR